MVFTAGEKLNRETLVGRLSAQVRDQIMSGGLAPGVALPSERELGEAFGVGRTTVREALQRLAAEGFLERRGKELVAIDTTALPATEFDMATLAARLSVEDVFEVRRLIEAKAVAGAAKNWVGDDLDTLQVALEEMRNPATDEGYHSAHLEFHLAVARISKNPVLAGVYESSVHLFFKLPSFWRVFGTNKSGSEQQESPAESPRARINGWKRHEALFQSLAERDAGEAVRLNDDMLERLERTLIERLEAFRH